MKKLCGFDNKSPGKKDSWSSDTVDYILPNKLKDYEDYEQYRHFLNHGECLVAVHKGNDWKVGLFENEDYCRFTVDGVNVLLPD